MDNMLEELVVAVLLTGVVVLFFLGNVRGTLISVITIPVSLGMALLAMVPLGMTLNSSTLIGLLLSIGRLVDDSIIDVENVLRRLEDAKRDMTAESGNLSAVSYFAVSSARSRHDQCSPVTRSGIAGVSSSASEIRGIEVMRINERITNKDRFSAGG